jgi:hypothetical protein
MYAEDDRREVRSVDSVRPAAYWQRYERSRQHSGLGDGASIHTRFIKFWIAMMSRWRSSALSASMSSPS